MNLIYIIEDDENIREIEEYTLENAGFQTVSFGSIEQCAEQMKKTVPDLLLVDIMLPDGDGLQFVEELRRSPQYEDIPVIIVTAKTREIDIVKGLDHGADDYITKPFSVLELTSRVKSLLRRTVRTSDIMGFEGLVIDLKEHKVTVDGEEVILTNKEFDLLNLLMSNRGRVLSRSAILEHIWGFDYEGESRTVDMHISTLRQKLDEWGKHIITIRNVGYVIRPL
ncbi:MAG: response regulator transcription factor [Erysipelotrichaceae bacterium]|nr:response regulator transcription factor [Erysipelotrichaceae bacterium]